MPKIDIATAPKRQGSGYPLPFRLKSPNRIKQALGDAGGLTDFGVNLVQLPPGEWSSQRHWHSNEDEFVYVLQGTLTLVTDAGETQLHAGDCAAFPKNSCDAHHIINKGSDTAVYLEVGTRTDSDVCSYPDADLHFDPANGWYTHKDGTLYPKE